MVLENYRIQDDGIWISKKELQQLRDHYHSVTDTTKGRFSYPYYVGKADVITDILKMFEPLEG